MTVLTENFAEKKLVYITDHHKMILKMWLVDDPGLHYYLEKLFWKIEEDLSEVKGFFVDPSGRVYIVSDSKKLKSKIESFVKKFDRKIDWEFISESQLKKLDKNLIDVYDPTHILNESKRLKGGIENNG